MTIVLPTASLRADTAQATRDGRKTADHTLTASQTVLSTLFVTALSIVTAIGFSRVFDAWDYLPIMLAVVFVTHLSAFGLRLLRAPAWLALPLTLAVIVIVIGWRLYPNTMTGPFPTGDTWKLLQNDLALARDQFATAVPPVAAIGGFMAGACLITALAGMLADAFAFRAYGRMEAVVPSAVVFVFTSALGANRNRVSLSALWMATALAVVALLRASHAQAEHTWLGSRQRVTSSVLPVAIGMAGLAAAGAVVIGPRIPGADAQALVDTHHRTDVTAVVSPLVGIRSQLVNLTNLEMFTVKASQGLYWRLTGLSQFDGETWSLPADQQLDGGSPSLPDNNYTLLDQEFRLTGLAGNLLPAALSAARTDSTESFWVADTGSLVMPDPGIKPGMTYAVQSALVDTNPEILRTLISANAPGSDYRQLPSGFPDEARVQALQAIDGAATDYDKARALQDWFRNNFTYDLTVQRGHSNNAIRNFLEVRRGYCEQFAGTYAAMARSVGLSARVAVGFTQGDLGSDGLYHVFGRNAHAWAEVYFAGAGWVLFDPTPGRGAPGSEGVTGVAPAQAAPQQPSGNGRNVTVTAPPRRADTDSGQGNGIPKPTNTAPKDAKPGTQKNSKTGAGTAASPVAQGFVVVLALAGLWALFMPLVAARLRARKRRDDPAGIVWHNWVHSSQALETLGFELDPTNTPQELAVRAAGATGIDRNALGELARQATAARYGNITDDQVASRSDALCQIIVESVRDRLTWQQRLSSRFDPRQALALSSPR